MTASFETLRWEGDVDGHLLLLDQTRLPSEVVEIDCNTVEDVWQAIKRLSVRGAPAIGCAAAYGVCLSVLDPCNRVATPRTAHTEKAKLAETRRALRCNTAAEQALAACDYLATSRPTAVNLFWALQRMRETAQRAAQSPPREFAAQLLTTARSIHDEDRQMCVAMGRHGADLLADLPLGSGILTHCNTGALATGGEGTALAVIFELARRDRQPHVWVDETRPLLQGARLTAWELMQRDIDCTLICDSMAAHVMREGHVQAVLCGADSVAANGDAANKIGTLSVAILARHFQIPFYLVAPTSTFDRELASGDEIPIEQRDPAEITHGFGCSTAPENVSAYNPAFDVTPAALLAATITERGIIQPVDSQQIAQVLED